MAKSYKNGMILAIYIIVEWQKLTKMGCLFRAMPMPHSHENKDQPTIE